MALRVLLADESATIKKVMQLALQDYGVEVRSVPIGLDVVPVAKSFKPDIIFADILLSKKNGYEVCAEVKADSVLSKIPFVLMWSGFMDYDQGRADKSGVNDRLEKPFDADKLRTLVKSLVPETNENIISNYITFPNLPEIQEDQKPEAKSIVDLEEQEKTNISNPVRWSDNSYKRDNIDSNFGFTDLGKKPLAFDSNLESANAETDVGEVDDFQPVPLPKRGTAKIISQIAELKKTETQDPNDLWKFRDLNQDESNDLSDITAVDISTKSQPSISFDEIDLSNAPISTTTENEMDLVQLGIKQQPSVNAKPASFSKEQIIKEAIGTLTSTENIEHLIKKEAHGIIEEIAWKVLPEICERIVREEIQKLLKDSERL